MKTIKFRGKRVNYNEWVEGDLIHGVNWKKGKIYILPLVNNLASIKNCDPLDGCEVIPETVGQFTGLKDKNGKEIYEGDTIKITYADNTNEILTAGFNSDKARFCLYDDDGNTYGFDNTNEINIVGNIHDERDFDETGSDHFHSR